MLVPRTCDLLSLVIVQMKGEECSTICDARMNSRQELHPDPDRNQAKNETLPGDNILF
jgi:hypothetical protein